MNYLENCDQRHAHCQAQDASNIGYKPDQRHFLVADNLRDGRIFDIHIDQGQIFPSVPVWKMNLIREGEKQNIDFLERWK